MADIRIRDLPDASPAVPTDYVAIDNGTTRKVPIVDLVNVGRPLASQAEAEAGVEPTKAMTALATKQAVTSYGLLKDENLADLTNTVTARSNLGLGSAATSSTADFATAAQGSLADSSIQPGDKASQAEAESATDDAKFVTPLKVGQAIDGRTTKLYGASSLARTIPARFGDVIDLDDWLDGGGTLGSVATNNAQIASLIAYMGGAGANKTYRSKTGRQFAFTASFTIPSTVKMRMEGALWRYFGNTVTSGDLIHFNGCDFDTLRFHLPDTYFRVRPVKVTGCRGDFIECISDTPIDNYNGSNIDWAVRLYGRNSLEQENRIGEIHIENFNKTVIALGDSFAAADPQYGGYLGYLRLKNFEKGLNIRNIDGMSFRGGRLDGRTSGLTTGQPGQNGILVTSGRNMHIYGYSIFDSPEHGVRLAADDTGVEVPSNNNDVHDITIKRAVQCGLKIWSGNLTYQWTGGKIHDITVEDAIWGNPNTTGFNYSAFLLQNFQNVNFHSLSAVAKDQAYSGREAFFIGAGGRSTLSNLRSYLGGRVNAVRFSEFNNGESDTVNNLAANNQVKIEGLYSEGHTGDAVYLDHPSQPLRDIVITDAYAIGGVNMFNGSAAAARFAQPCIFEGGIRGHSGALSALPASANITTINKRTSVA